MVKKIKTEYRTKYHGGPADGLETKINISENEEIRLSCLTLQNLVNTNTPLGKNFMKGRGGNTRVAVYFLDKEKTKEKELNYRYLEITSYAKYLTQYTKKDN